MIEKQLNWLYKAKADVEDDYQYICNRLWFAAHPRACEWTTEPPEREEAALDELVARIKQIINGAGDVESHLGTDDWDTCKEYRLKILNLLIAEWETKRNLK